MKWTTNGSGHVVRENGEHLTPSGVWSEQAQQIASAHNVDLALAVDAALAAHEETRDGNELDIAKRAVRVTEILWQDAEAENARLRERLAKLEGAARAYLAAEQHFAEVEVVSGEGEVSVASNDEWREHHLAGDDLALKRDALAEALRP